VSLKEGNQFNSPTLFCCFIRAGSSTTEENAVPNLVYFAVMSRTFRI